MEFSDSEVKYFEKKCDALNKKIDESLQIAEKKEVIEKSEISLNETKNDSITKKQFNEPVLPQLYDFPQTSDCFDDNAVNNRYSNQGKPKLVNQFSIPSSTFKQSVRQKEVKYWKQVIPLNKESLIDDIDKAQKQENLRIRLEKKNKRNNKNFKIPFFKKISEKIQQSDYKNLAIKFNLLNFFKSINSFNLKVNKFINKRPQEVRKIRTLRNQCLAELLIIVVYCGLGALLFRFTESSFENFYKCGVKRVKREFLDDLWKYSFNLKEDEWKSMARRKLMEFEDQLHAAHEAGIYSYSGKKSWTFLNSMVYSLTVITTIGYGHIAPTTTTGRAVTIVYAIFGIPMFLIILADFGKLFTRGIKFLWAFIRRLYYTGSCRKVRKTAPVQEVMKGVQLVYDFATFRRPSNMNSEVETIQKPNSETQPFQDVKENLPHHNESTSFPDTPVTPTISTFAIDDEFNLPISVAISILLGYIFIGATLYHFWEDNWSFFESFYFVFISMSTIGFGDYVPTHPIYMMCSIIYLVFGLALTSMCINVVQVMLSDHFKQASQKLGATIGLEVASEGGSILLQPVNVNDICTQEKDLNDKDANAKEEKSS